MPTCPYSAAIIIPSQCFRNCFPHLYLQMKAASWLLRDVIFEYLLLHSFLFQARNLLFSTFFWLWKSLFWPFVQLQPLMCCCVSMGFRWVGEWRKYSFKPINLITLDMTMWNCSISEIPTQNGIPWDTILDSNLRFQQWALGAFHRLFQVHQRL